MSLDDCGNGGWGKLAGFNNHLLSDWIYKSIIQPNKSMNKHFFHPHGYNLPHRHSGCALFSLFNTAFLFLPQTLKKKVRTIVLVHQSLLTFDEESKFLFVLNHLIASVSPKVIIIRSEILPHLFPTLYALYLIKHSEPTHHQPILPTY